MSTTEEDPRIAARVVTGPEGYSWVTCGAQHVDGYRITVGWSAEDDKWVARASGVRAHGGDTIGMGDSHEQALFDLACALCATVDLYGELLDKAEARSRTESE